MNPEGMTENEALSASLRQIVASLYTMPEDSALPDDVATVLLRAARALAPGDHP